MPEMSKVSLRGTHNGKVVQECTLEYVHSRRYTQQVLISSTVT